MKIVGIISEYNPFHRGHAKQFYRIRQQLNENCAIVCLMSGNYVQRGTPAIFDKSLRAKAAVAAGADLVLELPTTCALSSAEGFASGGVRILSGFCDYLSFGTETGSTETLTAAASALLSPDFPCHLKTALESGKSFPAARAEALAAMGQENSLFIRPNDILAVEYCKAILVQNSAMLPLAIRREGNYHADIPDPENPSATSLRNLLVNDRPIDPYVPDCAANLFRDAPLHTLQAGERAILARLRTMNDAEFEALPYGNEGLWRKFMHNCRRFATLEDILTATKSKRYTRSRLDRMMMCAFLGIDQTTLESPAPYTRILAFNDTGRQVLRKARLSGMFLNAGESFEHPFWALEKRWGDLYGLFCTDGPEAPGCEESRRVIYLPEVTLFSE